MAAPIRKAPKRNIDDDAQSIGSVAEVKYNGFLSRIGNRVWNTVKQAIDSNFGMGVLLTAVAVVAVMAVVPGWMGPMGRLAVGGVQHPAVESAMGTGIEHALAFLSPIEPSKGFINYTSIATLLTGGLAGRYLLPKLFKEAPALNASDAKEKAEQLGITPILQPELALQQNLTQNVADPIPANDKPANFFTAQLAQERDAAAGLRR